jgi:glycosyltransferase involved in cell wall biosynthesis
LLGQRNIDYRVVYGQPDDVASKKRDTTHLDWGTAIQNVYINFGGSQLVWQKLPKEVFNSDLIVIGQENKNLQNYMLQMLPLKAKVAFFGHGRNFQARNMNSAGERWKRYWAKRVHWWFGYTEETRRHLASLGFPPDKITVCNNSIDTQAFRHHADSITDIELADLRTELGLRGENVAVYVGGLYAEKRLDFLLDAADLIRTTIQDFELIVVGGGEQLNDMKKAAESRSWLKVVGPRFGKDKALFMAQGKVFLMPGLVGLAVLDAATLGLPVVTTNFPWHSPEVAYLNDGVNGLIIKPYDDKHAYAKAVCDLLSGPTHRLSTMARESKLISETYTIEGMARNFAAGVELSLKH